MDGLRKREREEVREGHNEIGQRVMGEREGVREEGRKDGIEGGTMRYWMWW